MNYFHAGPAMERDFTPDVSKTIRALGRQLISQRKHVLKEADRIAAEKAEVNEVYSVKLAAEKCAALDSELRSVIESEKGEARAAVAELIKSKRERFESVALTPPSEEQVRLLQAVSLRAADLSLQEVTKLCEKLADNHQALRSLAYLAKQSGINVTVPAEAADFEENISELSDYLSAMVSALDKPDGSLNYLQVEFYNYPDTEHGTLGLFCSALDGTSYTTAQAPTVTPFDKLKAAEEAALTEKDYEKAERIQKFIEANDDRLLSNAERLNRDVAAVITGE